MINAIVAFNFLSEPGAISELTFRTSLGQPGTIALNLFAVHLGATWTTRLYVNFINRIIYFFRWPVFQRMLPTCNFFSSEAPLRIFPSSLPFMRYLEELMCTFPKGERWKSLKIKKTFAKKRRNIIFQ